jgi:hypothetical protein
MIYALLSVSIAYLAQTLTLVLVVRQNDRERVRRDCQVEGLLTRIQAPEVAVAQSLVELDGPPGLLACPVG